VDGSIKCFTTYHVGESDGGVAARGDGESVGFVGVFHGGSKITAGVAQMNSLSKRVWTALRTSYGVDTILDSGRLTLCKEAVVVQFGRRSPFIYISSRWYDFGFMS
jgi:hypothetical protein